MSEGKLLLSIVGFLLILGLITPWILGFFIDISSVDTSDSLIDPFITLVDDGVSFPLIGSVNPFDLLFGLKSYFLDSLVFFSFLPDFIIAIVFILSILGIFYALIKLLPTT